MAVPGPPVKKRRRDEINAAVVVEDVKEVIIKIPNDDPNDDGDDDHGEDVKDVFAMKSITVTIPMITVKIVLT